MPRPLNVLSLCWEYPPFVTGGLGVACWGLNKALVDDGLAELHVLTSRLLVEKSAADEVAGAYDGQYRDAIDQASKFAAACKAASDEWEIDIIHAHDWVTFPAALALGRTRGCPVVAHFHSTEFDRAGAAGSEEILRIEASAFDQADAVVVVSRYTGDILQGLFGDRAHGGPHVVYNGHLGPIDIGRPLNQRARRAIFVGRMTHQKGMATLLAALRGVLAQDEEATVSLVGGGFLEPEVRAIVQRHQWLGRVRLEGVLGRSDIDSLLDDSRVLVMPSSSEPFGLVAFEAMARGVPVIASARSGVLEVNPHAEIVATSDIAAWTTAIRETMCVSGRVEMQRLAAVTALTGCTWNRAAANLDRVFRKCLSRLADEPVEKMGAK